MGGLALVMVELEYDPRQEQVDGDKDDAGDPERDVDRGVDHAPVGRNLGKPPGTGKMENNGGDNQQNQNNCKSHTFFPFQTTSSVQLGSLVYDSARRRCLRRTPLNGFIKCVSMAASRASGCSARIMSRIFCSISLRA